MKHRFRGVRWLALTALVAGVIAVPSALADDPQGQADTYGSGLWFVELNGAPTAAGGSAATNKAEKAAFRAEAKKENVAFTERQAFDTLWNGLSIATSADAARLKDLKGVKAVYPVGIESIPPTQSVSPELTTAIQMTGADVAQAAGYDGTGVKVGIVDTGIDVDHPDLGGDGVTGGAEQGDSFPNSRIVTGFDFVGDAYNADPSSLAYSPTPVPDANPDDCNGHGTHVSGIVGANGIAKGVAPGVTFGAYRIFGCGGSANDDVILLALERAFADGMDIVNMSLGDAFNSWPQAPLAQASDTLLKNGVVVVASIGNSGANGVYSNGAPGVGNGIIGVASYDNTDIHNVPSFISNPDGISRGYFNIGGAPAAPTSGTTADLVYVGRGCSVPLDPYLANPAGKVALIDRGQCTFNEKYQRAITAGATGIVVANNIPGLNAGGGIAPSVPGTFAITISLADGNALKALIVSSPPVTLTWTSSVIDVPNPSGGTISSFSSFGLNAELTLKPDIGAPGGLIRSTYPIEQGSYATISGTSMASPHVAGAVALLLDAHPNTNVDDVRDILQNSADPKVRFGFPYLDNTHRQGAGMLDIPGAIDATTLLQPGKISLGEGNGDTVKIKLTNSSGSPVTYDLSHEPAAGTTGTFLPLPNANPLAYSTDFASASFSSPSVTVPGNGTANVQVTITPNAAMPDKGVYGGYIKFTPQGRGQEYRVPYAGFKGDYQSIQVLTGGFPLLSRLTACAAPGILRGSECFGGGTYGAPPAGDAFTFATGLNETPMFRVHLDHQARSLDVDIYEASNDKWVGTGISLDYLSRNSAATSFFAYAWDGNAKKGQGNSNGNAGPVADGTYYAKITLIKALGTKQQAETWTSPNFVIDRP